MRVRRLTTLLIFVCVVAIIASAGYLRTQKAQDVAAHQHRDLGAVSRMVLYRVLPDAGPRFGLAGAESSIRIVSHLALDRGAAWPVEQYQSSRRYPYGLELIYRDPKGQEQWRKRVYISSAVSKGEAQAGRWTQEAVYSETRTFVPTDPRITQVELPEPAQVDASLEVRLLEPGDTFAMVRAYGLSKKSKYTQWIQRHSMSPEEKRSMVQGITYLQWDEVNDSQQDKRLAFDVSRLTAASSVRGVSKIIPLFVSKYRVPRALESTSPTPKLQPPWNRNFVVQGPAHLSLKLDFDPLPTWARRSPSRHHLWISLVDSMGQQFTRSIPFDPPTGNESPSKRFPIEVPQGLHTLKLRWQAPRSPPAFTAQMRPKGPGLPAFHAHRLDSPVNYELNAEDLNPIDLSKDQWQPQTWGPTILPASILHSPMYYLEARTPGLHFAIPGDSTAARMFRVKIRDWDRALGGPVTKSLRVTFLDANKKRILSRSLPIQQEFDPDSWVPLQGLVKGEEQAEGLGIRLGQAQILTGLAPKNSAWIELDSEHPLLATVSASIPHASYRYEPPQTLEQWQAYADRPRNWVPLVASEHQIWDRKGWRIIVHTPRHPFDPERLSPPEDPDPKWWRSIQAEDRPFTQRVFEETPFMETDQGLVSENRVYASQEELWEDCAQCWIEIPPYRSHRIIDRYHRKKDPEILWIAGKGEISPTQSYEECRLMIDGEPQPRPCPADKERWREPELSGGSHALLWKSSSPSQRLFLDRWSLPQDGRFDGGRLPIYTQRSLETMRTRGLRYAFVSRGQEPHFLHFRVYRRSKRARSRHASSRALSPPARFSVAIDRGNPARKEGEFFEQFTPAQRELSPPLTQETELVFLDAEHSGAYERYDLKVFVGPDIVAGQHQVHLRPLDGHRYWVRAFERDLDVENTSTRLSSK